MLIVRRRLTNEHKLLENSPLKYNFTVCTDFDNPYISYFLICGQKGTPYEGGEYIGKLTYPQNYPIEGPTFCIFTPNGRFKTERDIGPDDWCHYKVNGWSSTSNILNVINDIFTIWSDDDTFEYANSCGCNRDGPVHLCESWEEREIKARNAIQYNITHYEKLYEKFDRSTLHGINTCV